MKRYILQCRRKDENFVFVGNNEPSSCLRASFLYFLYFKAADWRFWQNIKNALITWSYFCHKWTDFDEKTSKTFTV